MQLTNVIVTPSMIKEYLEQKGKEQEALNQSAAGSKISLANKDTIMQFQEP